jgi:hypothetical protein
MAPSLIKVGAVKKAGSAKSALYAVTLDGVETALRIMVDRVYFNSKATGRKGTTTRVVVYSQADPAHPDLLTGGSLASVLKKLQKDVADLAATGSLQKKKWEPSP